MAKRNENAMENTFEEETILRDAVNGEDVVDGEDAVNGEEEIKVLRALKKKLAEKTLEEKGLKREEVQLIEKQQHIDKSFQKVYSDIGTIPSRVRSPGSDTSHNSTIGETKQKCECLGCSCKKTDKTKKKGIIHEEPVFTDEDDKNAPPDVWTTQRKHHFLKCLWKLKYNRVVTNVYLNNLKKEEDTWSWRLISLSTFTSGLTVANNVEEEPTEYYNVVVNGSLTLMSMLTSLCAAWLKKKNFVEKINEIDKYVLNINRICEELDVQFSILDTDRLRYEKFKKKYKDQITSILSASPIIPPDEWKRSIQEITLKYPELINPDNSEENKLWPWFGDMVIQEIEDKDGTKRKIHVRKQTAFMDQMRNTKTHKLKSTCCFDKREERDIYT